MAKGNPNNDTKQNFVAKVYDPSKKDYVPIYIAPDATNLMRGDVFLSDATNSTDDALKGVTAATPLAVKKAYDNAENRLSKVDSLPQSVTGAVTFESAVTGEDGFYGDLYGTAEKAKQLTPGRTITIQSGAASQSGSTVFTGARDVSINIPKLDGTTIEGLIPLASIPQGALDRLFKVGTEEQRFNLTVEDVQNGDSVLQLDTGQMYIVVDENNLDNPKGYQEYNAGRALSAEIAEKLTGKTVGGTDLPIYLKAGEPFVIDTLGVEYGGTGAKDDPAIAANNLKYSSLADRQLMPLSNLDLNNYKISGSYTCSKIPQTTTFIPPKETESNVTLTGQNEATIQILGLDETNYEIDVSHNSNDDTPWKFVTNGPLDSTKMVSFNLDVINMQNGVVRQILRFYNDHYTWERLYLDLATTDANFPKRDAAGWTDWKKAGGGGGGGDGALLLTGDTLGDAANATATDSQSEQIIQKTSSTTASTLFTIDVEDLSLGAYSVVTRMKCSAITNTANLLQMTVQAISPTNAATTLKTVYIKPSYLTAANTWECISFGVNFNGIRGSKLRITCSAVSNSANVTYSIDYLKVIPSGTALGSIG